MAEQRAGRRPVREHFVENTYYLDIAANLLEVHAADALALLVENGYENVAEYLRKMSESTKQALVISDDMIAEGWPDDA